MTVDLFIPCFIDQLYPGTGFSVVKVLNKLGVEVHYNENQTCCGQPFFNSGYWKESYDLAKKFIHDFPENRPVICPSASCAGFIRNYYSLLCKDSTWIEECERLKSNVFEFTDFLVNVLKVSGLGAEFSAKVTYHDACSALREYGIKNEPRFLLENVKGLELIEMNENEVCCGFGGTFSAKHIPISTAMVQQKIENAVASGAGYITSTEASCLMNMEGYIRNHKMSLKTIHIADILASGW